MNQLVPLGAGAVPAAFQSYAGPDMAAAAQSGLQASFAVIGFKGRNWRLKYRGEEILIKDSTTGVPVPTLDVVIVGVSPNISKQWYDKKFTEGDDNAPDCFSINGMHPDPASPKKQCESCAVCPQNIWGSRVTDAGKKAKNCQDSRRVAVVPLQDIQNTDFGGPMMLRLPPTSLAGFASFAKELARFGAQPFMVHTQLGFDYDVAYPLITFKAAAWLNDEQAVDVKDAILDPQIERMLQEEVVEAKHDPAEPEASSALAAGGPPAAFAGQPVAQPGAQAAPAAGPVATAPVAQPAPPPVTPPAAPVATPAAPAAPVQAAPAAAKRSASPFGGGGAAPAQAAPAAPAAPVQAAAQPEQVAQAADVPSAQVVQQAPTDMEKAIDDLLAG